MYISQAQSSLAARRQTTIRPASARPLVLFAGDLLALATAGAIGFAIYCMWMLSPVEQVFREFSDQGLNWHGWGTVLVLTVLITYFSTHGHYTTRLPAWTELRALVLGTLVAMLCDSFIRIVVYGQVMGAATIIQWGLVAPSLMLMRHTGRRFLDHSGMWKMRTLVIGNAEAVRPVRSAFQSEARQSYDIVGSIAASDLGEELSPGWGAALLDQASAEFIVVALGADDSASITRVIRELARERVPFAVVPGLGAVPVSNISSEYFLNSDVVLLKFGNNLARPISRMMKTLFDQAVALLMIVLLAPLLLVVALMIRADGGPAFYGHRRIGENGRSFRCLKFRSMVQNGDAVLQELLATNPAAREEWLATQKLREDPRVTPIGRFLRQTSLDELPQLFNVLRREMSLVGPRPIVEAEVDRYGRDISFYYETRPGITGLWQVSGRSNTSYEARVRLDVWYVRNWSLWHDFAILLKTIPAVLAKEGAV